MLGETWGMIPKQNELEHENETSYSIGYEIFQYGDFKFLR
jgi:hypothetical protein